MSLIRKIGFGSVAAAALAITALPVGATPDNNWHVHDVAGGVKQSSVQMRSVGVVFFPQLFSQEGDTYQPAVDPVVCPDATDKAGTRPHGEHANRPHINGVCHTDEYIIHLRSASGGSDQVPEGWSSVPFNSETVYYRLSPRGQ